MTTKSKKITRGFTLVEILVVIAIIATLAGISFPIAKSMINQGKTAETKLRMREVEAAVIAFNEDHGHLPFEGASYPSSENAMFEGSFRQILRGLLGEWQASTNDGGENVSGKKYLKMPNAKSGKNGLLYFQGSSESIRSVVDGWGNDMYIKIDYNLDDELTQNRTSLGESTIKGKTIILISDGPDGEKDTDDDVLSWQ